MTITHEWFAHYSKWEAGRGGTRMLVNDPTRGYGIFIENMLNAAE